MKTKVPGYDYYEDDFMKALQEFSQEWEADQQQEDMEEILSYTEFDAYQDFTEETAIYPKEVGLEYTALGLASEAGEFAGKVKKWIRDGKKNDDDLIDELGDCLWYLARAAAELDVYLSDVAQLNRDKLLSRKERGVISGSGDNR